jgi:carboxyl-terminal processing protease
MGAKSQSRRLCDHHLIIFNMTEKETNVFAELENAISILKSHFLSLKGQKIDDVQLARKALIAMMGALKDPFTNYIPPAQLKSYQSRKVETIVGVGMHVEYDHQGIARVVSALAGAPADIDAICIGDELNAVDQVCMRGGDLQRLNKLLNGPENSFVLLTLIDDSGKTKEVAVERRPVDVEYMQWHDLDDALGLVRISWFSGTGYQWFIAQMEKKISTGTKGVILDLRSNSGGSIISTRNIFSSLCNQEVMYYGKKVGEDNIKDRVLGEHLFDIPIVVLINEGTYSAGEVLAGALQDYGRALVVGATSGGKGSMQQVFPLEGKIGGAMRITTATNCTPSGRIVQDNGIEPDVNAEQPYPELFVDDGPQNISREGRDYLKKLRLDQLIDKHGSESILPVWQRGDQQLQKAVETLKQSL